jgi:hypothetical protein
VRNSKIISAFVANVAQRVYVISSEQAPFYLSSVAFFEQKRYIKNIVILHYYRNLRISGLHIVRHIEL